MQVGAAPARATSGLLPYTPKGPSESAGCRSSTTTSTRADHACASERPATLRRHRLRRFPWGDAGGGESPKAVFKLGARAQPGQRSVVIISELAERSGAADARTVGARPRPRRLTVDKAIVKTDTDRRVLHARSARAGAGGPGRPLYLNFESGKYAFGLAPRPTSMAISIGRTGAGHRWNARNLFLRSSSHSLRGGWPRSRPGARATHKHRSAKHPEAPLRIESIKVASKAGPLVLRGPANVTPRPR